MKLEIEDLAKEFKGRAPNMSMVLTKSATDNADAEVDFIIDGFDKIEAYIILVQLIDSLYEGFNVLELEEIEEYFADEE